MTTSLRLLFILLMTSFIAGCAGSMVPLKEVDGQHFVERSLTKEQVKEAIMGGAAAAGWRAKDLGSDYILATYQIRTHTVHVKIDFTDVYYTAYYGSSNGMKMFCSEKDKKNHRLIVSNQQSCAPAYIHGNYKKWMDSLNTAIQNSLAAM